MTTAVSAKFQILLPCEATFSGRSAALRGLPFIAQRGPRGRGGGWGNAYMLDDLELMRKIQPPTTCLPFPSACGTEVMGGGPCARAREGDICDMSAHQAGSLSG